METVAPSKVLVLNQDYSALNICTVPKAFLLLFLGKAEMVHRHEKYRMRTIDREFPMPSVIRLSDYVKAPYRNGVVLTRQNIFKRDRYECQYCGSKQDLTLDHVLPKSRGGRSTWKNLVTACRVCNGQKGNKTPEEANMPLPRQPFKPNYLMFLREFKGQIEDEWNVYLGAKSLNSIN